MIVRKKVHYLYEKQIGNLLQREEYGLAEALLKKQIGSTLSSQQRSKIYEMLGYLKYQMGDHFEAFHFYDLSLKCDRKNVGVAIKYSNLLIVENRFYEAIELLKKYLGVNYKKKEILKLLCSCYAFLGDIEKAKFIFESVLDEKERDENLYIDYAYAYIINKDFKSAKRIILNALERFPESFALMDAYEEFSDLEYNVRDVKKELLFPLLENIGSGVYLRAATKLAESMVIRGYFRFEIEKALELLTKLKKRGVRFNNPTLLAAVIEYFTTLTIADVNYTINNVISFYGLKKSSLKVAVGRVYSFNKELIDNYIEELSAFYNYEVDKFMDEFDEEE